MLKKIKKYSTSFKAASMLSHGTYSGTIAPARRKKKAPSKRFSPAVNAAVAR